MMSILQNTSRSVLFLFFLACAPLCAYDDNCPSEVVSQNSGQNEENACVNRSRMKKHNRYKNLSYYLYAEDFVNSFIEIPSSNVSADSSTVSSRYLAGRAPIYNQLGLKAGTCSASFLCMDNGTTIFTDISNYLSVDNGLIVSWFTPTTLLNLELDTITRSMVTECIVVASTKVGFNPYYGKTFNMIVSSDGQKIYFKLSKI